MATRRCREGKMLTLRVFHFRLLLILVLVITLGESARSQGAPQTVQRMTVELFSDFQCPYCAQFAPAIRELQTKGLAGILVTINFRYFPLSIHPDGQLAARASLAAKEQGRFWEMHDLLFANQAALKRDDLMRYAAKLGLDLNRFRRDLDSDRLKKVIDADLIDGGKLGVTGTPTFFLNGRPYLGVRSFDQLKQLVQYEEQRVQTLSEVTDNLMSRGPADAAVTLEFFADLQSPVSRPALDVLDEVVRRYPAKVRIQFRNFPLARSE